MKWQIEGQNLRLRIGEEELARLLAGHAIEAPTRFARAFAMVCTLRLGDGTEAELGGQPGQWYVTIPAGAVRELAARLPTRDGLSFTLAGDNADSTLVILFDVDVRDSVRQRHPR